MKNSALLMDYYELTMANSHFVEGRADQMACFDYYFRRIPEGGGLAIFAGLEQLLRYVENLSFSAAEIEFLRAKKIFSPDFLDFLANFRFRGEIWSVDEGQVVFPNEPLLTVRAPLIDCQLIETFLLLTLNHQSLIATKASRIVRAAQGKPVFEFGSRRAHGADAAHFGARAAFIGGVTGTANVYSHFVEDIPVVGTMAHAYVQSFSTEYEAFLQYAKTYPEQTVLLVDTYDTLRKGVPNAIRVHQNYLQPRGFQLQGIRIDSGDLAYLSNRARKMLDAAGMKETKIIVSNGLDEYFIQDLILQEAKIDAFGVGERLTTARDEPVFGGVYKIVSLEEKGENVPKIKLSENVIKTTTPARKQLWRLFGQNQMAIADVVTLFSETIPAGKPYLLFDPEQPWKQKTVTPASVKPLLQLQFQNGQRVKPSPSLAEIRAFCAEAQQHFWTELRRLHHPSTYFVDLSRPLWALKQKLIEKYSGE